MEPKWDESPREVLNNVTFLDFFPTPALANVDSQRELGHSTGTMEVVFENWCAIPFQFAIILYTTKGVLPKNGTFFLATSNQSLFLCKAPNSLYTPLLQMVTTSGKGDQPLSIVRVADASRTSKFLLCATHCFRDLLGNDLMDILPCSSTIQDNPTKSINYFSCHSPSNPSPSPTPPPLTLAPVPVPNQTKIRKRAH
jgi:hypothetical protein